MRSVIKTARQLSDNWYKQRTIILKFIEKIIEDNPDKVDVKWFGEKIHVVIFGYNDDVYFWWDGVDGDIIECSGLEIAAGRPNNGKLATNVLWSSDPSGTTESLISKLPIRFH